jgi:hypothetical protein
VALFALSAVGLAAAAHVIGGGTASAVVALAAVPGVMLVVNLLATRRRSLKSLLPVMAVTQFVLHQAFMVTSSAAGCQVGGGGGGMARMAASAGHIGSDQHSQFAVRCAAQMKPTAMSGIWPPSLMFLMHVLATVLLALLLAHGETAVWALASWLGFRGLRLTRLPRPLALNRSLPVLNARVFRPISAVHRRTVRRRGPPVPPHVVV